MHRIFTTPIADVWPHYVAKLERKGRTRAELDEAVHWLTGLDRDQVEAHLDAGTTFEEFFAAASLPPEATLITGVVCGVRVEDVEDPLMQKVLSRAELVDELARGKAVEKVLRG